MTPLLRMAFIIVVSKFLVLLLVVLFSSNGGVSFSPVMTTFPNRFNHHHLLTVNNLPLAMIMKPNSGRTPSISAVFSSRIVKNAPSSNNMPGSMVASAPSTSSRTTRSRAVKRSSSAAVPQRSTSSESLTGMSLASSTHVMETSSMDYDINSSNHNHNTKNNMNSNNSQQSLNGSGSNLEEDNIEAQRHHHQQQQHSGTMMVPMEIISKQQQQRQRSRSFSSWSPLSSSSWWMTILDSPSTQTGRLLVLGASAIYGTNFATVKLLDDSMPLSISAALRFGLASAVVSAMVIGRESDDVDAMVEKERNLAFWSGAEVGLWYSIGYLAQAEGLQTVAAGKSAFFNSLAVVVVPLLDALVRGKILQNKEIASVALACFGVGLLEVGPTGLNITPGDILAFMQTIFFGIGYWRLGSVSHAHPHQAARVTVGQLTAVAGGATLYALTEFALGHLEASVDLFVEWLGDPFILCALVWTGLISTALALYLETVALKVVSATELTLLMTTTSLWGASFAYLTIGEVLSPTGMVGGLMILAGCGLSAVASPTKKEKAETPSAERISVL